MLLVTSQGVKQMHTTTKRGAKCLQDALRHFNELPPEAYVRPNVVAALFGCSKVTVLRWAAAGKLPPLHQLGPGVSAFTVGPIRQALRARQN